MTKSHLDKHYKLANTLRDHLQFFMKDYLNLPSDFKELCSLQIITGLLITSLSSLLGSYQLLNYLLL